MKRYTARLVTEGLHQQACIDYYETFGQIVKHATIRLILYLVVSHKWSIH